jgi:non-heme chloroperoxidase
VRKLRPFLAALAVVATGSARAQDVTGTWQAALTEGERSSRLLLQIAREDDGRLTAALYNLDQGGFGAPAVAFTTAVDGRRIQASFGRGVFEGIVSGNVGTGTHGAATRLSGTWTSLGGRGTPPPQPLSFVRPTASTTWRDTSAHRVRFVTVAPNVRLEVVDWGGPTARERAQSGPPIVLLTGAGNNAHVFDEFAPKLADRHHVYGISTPWLCTLLHRNVRLPRGQPW